MMGAIYRFLLRFLVVVCRPPAKFGTMCEWWSLTHDMSTKDIQAWLAVLTQTYCRPEGADV